MARTHSMRQCHLSFCDSRVLCEYTLYRLDPTSCPFFAENKLHLTSLPFSNSYTRSLHYSLARYLYRFYVNTHPNAQVHNVCWYNGLFEAIPILGDLITPRIPDQLKVYSRSIPSEKSPDLSTTEYILMFARLWYWHSHHDTSSQRPEPNSQSFYCHFWP